MPSTKFSRATSSGACASGTGSSCSTRHRTSQQGNTRSRNGKRGRQPPPFLLRARSAYRFLPAFFFPPLAFFAIVFYPPLHAGFTRRIVSGCRLARSRDRNTRVRDIGHKEWLQQAILIPDVDYGCVICDVKHK